MPPPAAPIVVYGAGKLGRRLVAAMVQEGHPPAAVIDRDERLWGTSIEGVQVLSLAAAPAALGPAFTAVVGVWNPHGHRFADTAADLRAAGAGAVVPFHVLAAELPSVLPHFCHDGPARIEAARERIGEARELLADPESRATLDREIAWRLGDVSVAERRPVPDQYLVPLYTPREDEVVVDCGAFDGDTLRAFLDHERSFARYWAYEPDPANLAPLRATVESLPPSIRDQIVIREAATFDRHAEVRFDPAGDGGAVSEEGELVVRAVPLDDEPIVPAPTLIKADVEGAERATLLGAARIIAEARPVLAICVYHRPDDLWELPLLCQEIAGNGYRFHLRMHAEDGWETVLYAVPQERA